MDMVQEAGDDPPVGDGWGFIRPPTCPAPRPTSAPSDPKGRVGGRGTATAGAGFASCPCPGAQLRTIRFASAP